MHDDRSHLLGHAKRVLGAIAAAVLLVSPCIGEIRAADSGAASKPSARVVGKPRTDISFGIADPNVPAGAGRYTLTRVVKNGKAIPAPAGMKLDAKTGAFSWKPAISEAGEYVVEFRIVESPPRRLRTTTRRITVAAGPITTDRGEIGRLLRGWYAGGTAAGNTGDFYDNRDRGHSRLNTSRFPQLDVVEYPEHLKRRRLDWGLQLYLHSTHVLLGNSSTSSSPTAGGCNSRRAVMSARATALLYRQYRGGHLYIYPEHRDHDPGHNGRGGYGDLFPANVPYVITPQGSSGSDRPFLEAVAYTLAAFRPDVKKRLIRTGLLMPTVQMIFRRSNKNVKHLKNYLTGKAHPTAFAGGNVDALRMVRMAHAIRPATIPPMIQLAVIEEDRAVEGRDYFEAAKSEKLFDTPAAIARIVRSTKHTRRMVVSARGSYDINGRPLKFHWVVLRGDPERIKIKPQDKDGSVVELLVAYHQRRPIYRGARMESNRVDIGAFVHNGRYYSAPGFISFYSLDDEARSYDAGGRILEVSYGHGDTRIGDYRYWSKDGDIVDWSGLLDLAAGDRGGLAAGLLRRQFTAEEIRAFQQAAKEFKAAAGTKKEVQKAVRRALTRRRAPLRASVIVRIEDALNALKNDVNFYFKNAGAIGSLYEASKDKRRKQAFIKASSELRKLSAWMSQDRKLGGQRAFPAELEPAAGGLMKHYRNRIEQLNIAILQNIVYPNMLNWRHRRNYVDPRIATPKNWRDVYRYDTAGRLIGWTRYRGNRKQRFTADGAIVIKADRLGRAVKARTVKYVADRKARPQVLKQQPGGTILHYKYDSDDDRVGRVYRREAVAVGGKAGAS